jgi:hypothetical protein
VETPAGAGAIHHESCGTKGGAMMWRHVQRFLGVLVLATLAFGAGLSARADVTITMENKVKTSAGEQTTTVTQYYTPTKMRSEFGEASVSIVDLDKGRMITLMPAAKLYVEQTFDEVKKLTGQMKAPEPRVTVEETDETEEINGYNCRKIIVRVETTHGNMVTKQVTEHWMTTDVKAVEAVHEFQKNMSEALKDLPQSRAGLEVRQKFADEGLFPIKTVVHMQGPAGETVSTMTVTKIEEGDLDDELFEIPEGYTKQTFDVPSRGASGSKE